MMKENQITHKVSFFGEEPLGRRDQVKQTREILQVNQKIKAMVTLRKMEQYSKISQYIRQKNEDHKVKRTLYMRNKFLDYASSQKKLAKQKSNLSIDNHQNPKHVYDQQMHEEQKRRIDYIDALLHFQEQFSKGLMQREYEYLLEKHLSELDEQTKKQDKAKVIKLVSKNIKEQLFNTYLKKWSKKKDHDGERKSQSILERVLSNGSIKSLSKDNHQNQKDKKINHNYSTRISPQTKFGKMRDEVSYIYKKRSKFSERRLSSINKLYYGQIDNLDMANDMGYKTRRINEFIFLKRMKDHRNTTYRSIADNKINKSLRR